MAPKGLILVYVYSSASGVGVRSIGLSMLRSVRRVTVRMPRPLLRYASAPAAAVIWITLVLPGRIAERRGWRRLGRLPMGLFRTVRWRSLWLGTFDLLAAPIEYRFSEADMRRWVSDAGLDLVSLRDLDGWAVLAERPSASSPGAPCG